MDRVSSIQVNWAFDTSSFSQKGLKSFEVALNFKDMLHIFYITVINSADTKTSANLSTNSKTPRNYHGINFEIDFMKKIFPNQSKSSSNLTFSLMFWLFGLFLLTLKHYWDNQLIATKKCQFGFWQWQKCKFWINQVRLFHDINLKNNIVNVLVLVTYLKKLH